MKQIEKLQIRGFNPYDNDQLLDIVLDLNNKLDEVIDAVNMLIDNMERR